MMGICQTCKGDGIYLKPPYYYDWCLCPNCEGLKFVDERTGLLVEYKSKGILKSGLKLNNMREQMKALKEWPPEQKGSSI